MKIRKEVSNIILLYSASGLAMSLLLLCFENFQYIEKSSIIVAILSLILLVSWCVIRGKVGFEEECFTKRLPAKIRLPISEITIYRTEYWLGFIFFIVGILSIPVTWIFWLMSLLLSICWTAFFHHPHVWAKDSFDLKDRINHPDTYKKDYEDGCFNYPTYLDGFEYFNQLENNGKITVLWSEILSVDATMVDYGVYSEIRLFILTTDAILQIEESTSGYLKFFEELQEHLENFNSMKMLIYMSGQFSETINLYKKQ